MRLELTTSAVTGRRSNQLSHWAKPFLRLAPSRPHRISLIPSHQDLPACRSTPRPISIGQLHMLPCFHLRPINLVVFKGSYSFRMGYLISRGASRLDAFSAYPVPTWLRCHGPGGPTAAPEVSPPRSSRTEGSSSQISYARAG